jgi:hypothetical protein
MIKKIWVMLTGALKDKKKIKNLHWKQYFSYFSNIDYITFNIISLFTDKKYIVSLF